MHEEPTEHDLEESRVTDYAMGELDGEELRAFERLLASQPVLAAETRSIRALAEQVKDGLNAASNDVALRIDQREAIMRAATSRQSPVIATIRWGGWSGAGLALAASLGIAFAWPALFGPGRSTSPAESEFSLRADDATAPGRDLIGRVETAPPEGALLDAAEMILADPGAPQPQGGEGAAIRLLAEESELARGAEADGFVRERAADRAMENLADQLLETEQPSRPEAPAGAGGGGGGGGGVFGGGSGAPIEDSDEQRNRGNVPAPGGRALPANEPMSRPEGAPASSAPAGAPSAPAGDRVRRMGELPSGFMAPGDGDDMTVRLRGAGHASDEAPQDSRFRRQSGWEQALDSSTWPKREDVNAIDMLAAAVPASAAETGLGVAPRSWLDVGACPWNEGHDLAFLTMAMEASVEDASIVIEFADDSVQAFRLIGGDGSAFEAQLVARDANDASDVAIVMLPIEIMPSSATREQVEGGEGEHSTLSVMLTRDENGGVSAPRVEVRTHRRGDESPTFRRAAGVAALAMLLRGELPRDRATLDVIRSLLGENTAAQPEDSALAALQSLVDRAERLIEAEQSID